MSIINSEVLLIHLLAGITTLTDTITCLICMKMYQVIASNYGIYLNFLMYSVSSLTGMVIMYKIVPETKGRTFSQIQTELLQQINEESPITSQNPSIHRWPDKLQVVLNACKMIVVLDRVCTILRRNIEIVLWKYCFMR